jgi:hypothetical protein
MKVRGCIGDDGKVLHGEERQREGLRRHREDKIKMRNTSILFLLNNYLI